MSSDPKPAAPSNVASCEFSEGQRLGKYAITRRLGAGGMGTVFLAEDVELKRTVALKVLPQDRADNPTLVKRFKAEGQAAAQLHHDNIVQVYEAGEIDGYLYLALEYVDGIDLLAWLRKRGPLPVKRSIAIVRQVASALQHAYERNIVHRDIKPSNLMVKADGTVKLTDMGLARSVDESMDTSITRAGTTVGTIDYMAPEQARNSKAADIRSDIYSLGCTWYHMLAGVAPFPEGSITNKVQSHFSAPRPDPRDRNPRIPAAVVAVMHRMMARLPEERYRNPAELLEDLSAESLLRADMKPDLLAALSDEASAGRRETGAVEPAEDESDWETVFRRVREAQEEDRQEEYDFDESSGRGGRDSTPQTREVATMDPPSTKQRTPRGKKKRREKPAAAPRTQPASEPEQAGLKPEQPGADERRAMSPAQGKKAAKRQKLAATEKAESQHKPKSGKAAKAARSKGRAKTMPAGPANPNTGLVGEKLKEIDIDVVKIGIILLAVVAAVGGLWWGANQFGKRTEGLEGSLKNPYGSTSPEAGVAAPSGGPSDPDSGKRNAAEEGSLEDEDGSADAEKGNAAETNGSAASSSAAAASAAGGSDRRIRLPDWVRNGWNPPESAKKPQVRLVRRGADDAPEFRSFGEALADLPREGAVVEFTGAGPYFVRPGSVSGIESLELRGHAGSRPILVVQESELDEHGRWLAVSDCRLMLDGIQLVFVRRGPAPDRPAVLLELDSSDLLMRRSSITTVGDPGPLVCIRSRGKSSLGNQILLDGSSLRGAGITAVALAGAASDLVLNDSLVMTESQPALQVQSRSGDGKTRHQLHVLSSTLVCGSYGLTIENLTPEGSPIPVEVRVKESEIVHSAKEQNRAAIRIDRWPLNEAAELEQPRPVNCRLRAEGMRLSGWTRLLDFAGAKGERIDVLDSTGWVQFWKDPLPSDSITAADVEPFAGNKSVQNRAGSEVRDWLTARSAPRDGARGRIGVDPGELCLFEGPWEARLLATARRRAFPPPQKFDRPAVSFDLRRGGSFQDFLNGPECPDGAHVVCRGTGLRQLEPVVISGKSLKIEFEQTDGVPLDVQPLSGTEAEALITVRSGRLELVNAPLRIPDSQRRRYPKSLVRVEGGQLKLQNCWLAGAPDAESSPIIDWSGSAEGESWGWVVNSVLVGRGDLLGGDLSGASCFFDNCLLVSGRNALRLGARLSAGELLLNRCTLSAAGTLFQAADGEQFSGLRVFVRETVFAAPGGEKRQQAALVDIPEDRLRQVDWWETATAYAPEIPLLNRAMPQLDSLAANKAMWGGEGHTVDQLSGPGSVLLQGIVDELDDVSVRAFTLQQGCRAATWAEDGGPIGVRPDDLGPSKEPPPPQKTSPASQPSRPPLGPNNPGF